VNRHRPDSASSLQYIFQEEGLTIRDLSPGIAIRIAKTFRDSTGSEFAKGAILHFKRRDYLPYHSGHTVFFEEATMYLCDLDETGNFVENRGNGYFEPYQHD
jgi:hypothetical protein